MTRRKLFFFKKIDREARREWKNALRFKNENHWLFIGFVLLIAALVIINTAYIIDRSGMPHITSSSSSASTPNQIKTSLQNASAGGYDVAISNVTENADTDHAFPFAETETMLILDFRITNKTAAVQHLTPVNQLFIHDRDGGLYKMHASMYVTNPLAAQDLAPGDSAEGQISFAIPKTQTKPLLFVDPGWTNETPVVFDVLH